LQALKTELPKATVLDNYYGGATLGDIKRTADSILEQHPDFKGVVVTTTVTTKGFLMALQQKGLAGKITFVGAGVDAENIAALRKGEINALVLHNPFEMGYRGVQTAVAVLKGEKVEKKIYTDVLLATAANIDNPEVQRLLRK